VGVASRRPPSRATTRQPGSRARRRTRRFCRGLPPGCRVVGLAPGRRDATQPQRAESSVIPSSRCGGWSRNTYPGIRCLAAVHTAGQSPRTRNTLAYIHWYINDYGRPRTSTDPNPTMRPDHGQSAGSCGVLPMTTEQKAFVVIPVRVECDVRESSTVFNELLF